MKWKFPTHVSTGSVITAAQMNADLQDAMQSLTTRIDERIDYVDPVRKVLAIRTPADVRHAFAAIPATFEHVQAMQAALVRLAVIAIERGAAFEAEVPDEYRDELQTLKISMGRAKQRGLGVVDDTPTDRAARDIDVE